MAAFVSSTTASSTERAVTLECLMYIPRAPMRWMMETSENGGMLPISEKEVYDTCGATIADWCKLCPNKLLTADMVSK